MAEIRKLRSAKRFGTRYGSITKRKFDKIEGEQRKLHKCPYCRFVRAKRAAAGIWICGKCGAKFTGKAYTIGKQARSREKAKAVEEIEDIEDITETEQEKEAAEKAEEEKEDMAEEADEKIPTEDIENIEEKDDEDEITEKAEDQGDEK